MNDIYVSTDVEADGPIPGPHSMLSVGSAAFFPDKTLVATYTANLVTLPGAAPHPDTEAWWKNHPTAWEECRRDPRPAEEVMPEYAAWIRSLPGRPVFVAYPLGFDFMFVHWYLMRFVGESPFSHSGLDIKTFAMAMMKGSFRGAVKRRMPARWFDRDPHTHVALDDAICQGTLFCNMLAEHLAGEGSDR